MPITTGAFTLSRGPETRRRQVGNADRSFLLLLMTATLVGGCMFEASTGSSNTDGTRTAEELELFISFQFDMQADDVTADIVCPTGLSGEAGRQVTCTGTTSDGYTLEIAVVEHGGNAFRWDVVHSVPVGTVKTSAADRKN